jgi:tripartite-type tricarboxylate transporter receptor subunit TctC
MLDPLAAGERGLRRYPFKADGDTAKALKTEEVKARLAAIGPEPVGMPPEEFQPFVRAELQKWAKLAREVGIRPE